MTNPLLMILFTIHVTNSMKGGSPARPGEARYLASIRKANIHHCSGVIVHEKHIITVAHMIAGVTAEDLRIFVGKDFKNYRYRIERLVRGVYLHPGFGMRKLIGNHAYYEHDIAVLKLEHSLIWTPDISYVPLVTEGHNWSNQLNCILFAWNFPDNRKLPIRPHWELIKLMGNELQQQWATYLGENQNFFGNPLGTLTIGMEDLGSPLVCDNHMTGLVIKEEQPSIMMSMAPYFGFIAEIIHDGLHDTKPGEFSYAASIWYNNTYACGGFIVDATHVATVGHCMVGYRMDDFIASVGLPPQLISLAGYEIHSNYAVKRTDVPPNWYIDHDFALLTASIFPLVKSMQLHNIFDYPRNVLAKPIVWNERTSPLPMTELDDFHAGQICEVLRWKYDKNARTRVETIKLMTSRVMILSNQCSQPQLDPSPQFQVPSFWGQSQYLMPIPDYDDVGNPIICNGNPVGFLIQAIPMNGKTTAILARFLKIRPYILFRNSSVS